MHIPYPDLEYRNKHSKAITTYNLDIYVGGDSHAFVMTNSEKSDRPIGDGAIRNQAEILAEIYDLKPNQVNLYAEGRDGEFNKCSFKHYKTGDFHDKPELNFDFEAGNAKTPATKESIEKHVARVEGQDSTQSPKIEGHSFSEDLQQFREEALTKKPELKQVK